MHSNECCTFKVGIKIGIWLLLGKSTFYPLSWGIIRVIGLITFIAPFYSYCETLHTNFSEYCIIFRRDSDILYIYTSIEKFEGTKGVIRINKSKKDRQHTDQRQNVKRTNNDPQNTLQKTKDRATPIPRCINLTKYYLFLKWIRYIHSNETFYKYNHVNDIGF